MTWYTVYSVKFAPLYVMHFMFIVEFSNAAAIFITTVDIILSPPPLGPSRSPKKGGGLSVISRF